MAMNMMTRNELEDLILKALDVLVGKGLPHPYAELVFRLLPTWEMIGSTIWLPMFVEGVGYSSPLDSNVWHQVIVYLRASQEAEIARREAKQAGQKMIEEVRKAAERAAEQAAREARWAEAKQKASEHRTRYTPPPSDHKTPRAEALKVLGLNDPVTPDEIRAAYRRAALQHHPDRGGKEETMVQVNLAYEALR